jgi:tellurite resistance protein TerC
MMTHQLEYIVFGIVLVIALVFDLGLLTKKNTVITIKSALWQALLWVALGLAYCVFIWVQDGQTLALEYLSAYLMEKSLSIDNIFVFTIIFTAFGVKEKNFSRVLLIGVLLAIVFRVIFITVGVALVEQFEWILYVFGAFLLYTGIKMFSTNTDEAFHPKESKVYRFLQRFLPLVPHDGGGRYIIRENGKPVYTTLFVVVVMLGAIDLVFALDSIPTVMGISRDKMVIYTSNIFAVLGLRSLFFLLRGAVSKFDYLQQGIAIVLIFIGVKMLGEHFIAEWVSKTVVVSISLAMIVICICGSIFYSIFMQKRGLPKDQGDASQIS